MEKKEPEPGTRRQLRRLSSMDPFSVRYDTCDETRWPRILRDVQFLNIPDPRALTSELESPSPLGEADVGHSEADIDGSSAKPDDDMASNVAAQAAWDRLLDALDNVVTGGALKELMCCAHSSAPSTSGSGNVVSAASASTPILPSPDATVVSDSVTVLPSERPPTYKPDTTPTYQVRHVDSTGSGAGVDLEPDAKKSRLAASVDREAILPIISDLNPKISRRLLTNFIFVADCVLVLCEEQEVLLIEPSDPRILRLQTARNAITMMARWIRRVTFCFTGPEDDSDRTNNTVAENAAEAEAAAAAETAAGASTKVNDHSRKGCAPEGPHAATIPLDTAASSASSPTTSLLSRAAPRHMENETDFQGLHMMPIGSSPLVSLRRSTGRTLHLVDARVQLLQRSQRKVFLGGSCNPTTWRTDIAIPAFEAEGISYYNPQVENWTPELVEVEACAKRDAVVLLFVIDRDTRAVASMNEVVEEICRGREVVLVVQDMDPDSELALGPNLLKDLNRGRVYLRDIAQRYGVVCYDRVEDAVQDTCARLSLAGTGTTI